MPAGRNLPGGRNGSTHRAGRLRSPRLSPHTQRARQLTFAQPLVTMARSSRPARVCHRTLTTTKEFPMAIWNKNCPSRFSSLRLPCRPLPPIARRRWLRRSFCRPACTWARRASTPSSRSTRRHGSGTPVGEPGQRRARRELLRRLARAGAAPLPQGLPRHRRTAALHVSADERSNCSSTASASPAGRTARTSSIGPTPPTRSSLRGPAPP